MSVLYRWLAVIAFGLVVTAGHAATPAVALGGGHTLFLKADGTVWAVGANLQGQLGEVTVGTNRSEVKQVPGLKNIVAIGAGRFNSYAIDSDGGLWGWGSNHFGHLGFAANTTPNYTPVKINGLPPLKKVTGGYAHVLALTTDGTLFAWGANDSGQLGLGHTQHQSTPTLVPGIGEVISIAAGTAHSVAVSKFGIAFAWGYNNLRQVSPDTATQLNSPTAVKLTRVAEVAVSSNESFARTLNGEVYRWGNGFAEPYTIADLPAIKALAATWNESLFLLDADGRVWASGENSDGTLGLGHTDTLSKPARLTLEWPALGIVAGLRHACAWNSGGEVACWGGNHSQQLAAGMSLLQRKPKRLTGAAVQPIGGYVRSFWLAGDGTLSVSGNHQYGGLCDPASRTRLVPVEIAKEVAAAVGGYRHTLILKKDGTVWTCGTSTVGQMGLGQATGILDTPTKISGLSRIVAISAGVGGNHSLALDDSGQVYAWGGNEYGGLGLGDRYARYSPTKITGLPKIAAISAGSQMSAALTSDGRVYVWGWGAYGLPGSVNDQLTPLQINLSKTIKAISLANTFIFALDVDGGLWAWGDNAAGMLGIGNTTAQVKPQQVSIVPLQAALTGQRHALALGVDGSLWTWGENKQGQLGNDTLTDATRPIRVEGVSGVTQLTVGAGYSLVRTQTGVYGWGLNYEGQLGDGILYTNATPAAVVSQGRRFSLDQTAPDRPVVRSIAVGAANNLRLVGVLLPRPSDHGRTTNLYLLASWQGRWYAHNGSQWQQSQPSGAPAYRQTELVEQQGVAAATGLDSSTLAGLTLWLGYGDSVDDMLGQSTYGLAWAVP